MSHDPIVSTIFLVFTGAAVIATFALYARQALLIAYMALGVLLGPWGFGLVDDPETVQQISHIGIIFLLFLLGLNLQPQELLHMVRKTTLVTLISSLVFGLAGGGIAWGFGYTPAECLLVGGAMSFSSTIIGLKLLPTTVLHHQRSGEIIISILLLQDLIAIVMLLMLQGGSSDEMPLLELARLSVSLPGLILFAWLFEKHVLVYLIGRFDRIHEYIFLMAIGWCLGVAELAGLLGLSQEIGAFIAGITLAASPIARFIAESLKPLRDFFLVLFFFSLGARFNLTVLGDVLVPALLLAIVALALKPPVFGFLLRKTGEHDKRSREIGFRLGQMSEFSLLIAVLAYEVGVIGAQASYLIQLATMLTFLASTYMVVLRFHTPIAISDELRRD